jgi:hypothetical protein
MVTTLALVLLKYGLMRQVSLPAGPGPLDNPRKGFAAYCEAGNQLSSPVSMTFEETGWKDLEPTEGKYAFGAWEQDKWDVVPAKGKDVVLRVYLDYPNKPSSVPDWLVAKGVKMTRYDEFGGGLTPDYENPLLQKSLLRFIAAFGQRYDHDPRIAYVQLGLLGHWGEWHTYPHDNLFASPAVQSEVIAAMHSAFPNKPLMARNASYKSCQLPWLGFHDDMIPQDTFGADGSWEFLPAIRAGGRDDNWKVAPIGGEMVPFAAKQYLGKEWDLLLRSVKEAHFTWIGPYCPALEQSLSDTEHAHVNELIRALGYEYQLKNFTAPIEAKAGSIAAFQIDGVNDGTAPFYFPWKVQLALIDAQNHPVQKWDVPADVRKWLPGPLEIQSSQTLQVSPGSYRVGLGIIDPATGKASIQFANSLEQIEGFTVMGSIRVASSLGRSRS